MLVWAEKRFFRSWILVRCFGGSSGAAVRHLSHEATGGRHRWRSLVTPVWKTWATASNKWPPPSRGIPSHACQSKEWGQDGDFSLLLCWPGKKRDAHERKKYMCMRFCHLECKVFHHTLYSDLCNDKKKLFTFFRIEKPSFHKKLLSLINNITE